MRVENFTEFLPSGTQPAKKLEQAFLEEMMKYMLPKTSMGSFTGGIGEEQFSSFLHREYAVALSERLDLRLEVSKDA